MAIDQLDLIKNQTKAVLRNKASGSAAKLRAETSLVGQASRLTGRMTRQLEKTEEAITKSRKNTGIPLKTDTVAEAPRPVKPAPDGYIRRSPVQPIRVPADYHRRMARKIAGGAALAVFILAALWLVLQTGLLAY